MRARIAASTVGLTLLAGSVGLAVTASAETTSTSTSTSTTTSTSTSTSTSPAATPTARCWCVRSGNGELRNLWFDPATGKCPAPYWGPVALGSGAPGPQGPTGATGPTGPTGPKGDSGDNAVKVVRKQGTLAASSPATQVVTLAGLPTKASGVVEFEVNNIAQRPQGTTVTVTAIEPSSTSTERSFTVAASGFTGSTTFTLNVSVVTIAA